MRRLRTERRASSRLSRAVASARSRRSRARAGSRSSRCSPFEVQRDRGEPLRERVVDLAGDPGALLGAGQPGALVGQPRALDRDPDLIGDGGEEAQLLAGQLPPGGAGDVHDPEGLVAEVEGDAGVEAEARRLVDGPVARRGAEAAALHHVDVPRGELAVEEGLDAPAVLAGHPHRLAQVGRQVSRGGAVELPRLGVEQPDPAGAQPEEIGDQGEGAAERLSHIGRAVQRLGDRVEDDQLARAAGLAPARHWPALLRCRRLLVRHQPAPGLPRPDPRASPRHRLLRYHRGRETATRRGRRPGLQSPPRPGGGPPSRSWRQKEGAGRLSSIVTRSPASQKAWRVRVSGRAKPRSAASRRK